MKIIKPQSVFAFGFGGWRPTGTVPGMEPAMGSTGDERFGGGAHAKAAFGSGPTGKGLPKNGVTSDSGRIRARSQTLLNRNP